MIDSKNVDMRCRDRLAMESLLETIRSALFDHYHDEYGDGCAGIPLSCELERVAEDWFLREEGYKERQ
jgi:hypothetical protein